MPVHISGQLEGADLAPPFNGFHVSELVGPTGMYSSWAKTGYVDIAEDGSFEIAGAQCDMIRLFGTQVSISFSNLHAENLSVIEINAGPKWRVDETRPPSIQLNGDTLEITDLTLVPYEPLARNENGELRWQFQQTHGGLEKRFLESKETPNKGHRWGCALYGHYGALRES